MFKNIFGKTEEVKKSSSFASRLGDIKGIFTSALEDASNLKNEILESIQEKEEEISYLQTQVNSDKNNLDETTRFITKVEELVK